MGDREGLAHVTRCASIEEAARALEERGAALLPKAGARGAIELTEALGRVLFVEEVLVEDRSTSLVRSADGLDLHTDHHRADFIVWHCLAQSDAGGDTLLVDAWESYATLSPATRTVLERVMLEEHSVFAGDTERHPLVTLRGDRPRVYYSYWLAADSLAPDEREAFEAFARGVNAASLIRVRLEPGDILAIDNGRMLHGRAPVGGNRQRHLRRYWVQAVFGSS